MEFPKINNGATAKFSNGKMTFTYIDSYGEVITETKPVLSEDEIKDRVMARLDRFHSAGPGSRESEVSRAERKWISGHPKKVLMLAFGSMDKHGQMEMEMMLSEKSHFGISSPEWSEKHAKERSSIVGDNEVPL